MNTRFRKLVVAAAAAAATLASPLAQADAVTDWNLHANHFVVEAKLGTPPAIRVMAFVQTAVLDALQAGGPLRGRQPASADAAVAAASRAVLVKLLPSQQAAIDAAYQQAIARIADGPARAQGIAAGERAAAKLLDARLNDGAATPESYRPHTTAGAYVPTVVPAATTWGQRRPWLMAHGAQVRPEAPPALASEAWARDFNEVRLLGRRDSALRTAEQTDIARFWEYSLPPIYFGVVHSVAQMPERDLLRNARLFAATAQALDDAMIAVFDAKYHYALWRPVTAIRNGDLDGNDATPRDATWAPLIDNPMHPEYPSGHAILAAAVGTVLKTEIGAQPTPVLVTRSPTANGATRQWNTVEDFVREVGESRILAGIHFRFAIDASDAMGRQIGTLAVARHLEGPK
ncbi:MAG: vanadium-dependent haloperoxidase [Rubrivivax sp.]|nr:vanadium-dependent haloperoxidase [Rubrivivax sp.]